MLKRRVLVALLAALMAVTMVLGSAGAGFAAEEDEAAKAAEEAAKEADKAAEEAAKAEEEAAKAEEEAAKEATGPIVIIDE
jgi:hypothetical protein